MTELIPEGDRPMTDAEYRLEQARTMTEKQLQAVVVACARRQNWLVYHTKYSLGSAPGYPDLHLVHAERGLSMMVELKTEKGKLTEHQQTWISGLEKAGVDVRIWRPIDWFEKRIEDALYPPEFSS